MQFPKVNSVSNEDGCWRLSLLIESQLDAFKGHFDSAPIIPGVVQIQWALHFANECLPQNSKPSTSDSLSKRVECIEKLKFQNVIQPNMSVILSLKEDKGRLEFSFESDKKHSSGKIVIS